MLTPYEIQYLRNWQFSIVNFIRDRDLDLIRCLRMISTRMLPGTGPPFNLEEHKKQTDFSEADERMSSSWLGAIEGMIRRGDNELAHLFRTVSDEVMDILGFPNILQERSWVHPHKILGSMCKHLASLRWGRSVLNRRLYRNKFKPRAHTGASSRATTWEADVADSIASLAKSSEGRRHLDDCILSDFSGFFDWGKATPTGNDTDDEDCPPLEDVGASRRMKNFDRIIDEMFAEMFSAEQTNDHRDELQELAGLPSGSCSSALLSQTVSANVQDSHGIGSTDGFIIYSDDVVQGCVADPAQGLPSEPLLDPVPAAAEQPTDPALASILDGRSVTEHLQMFEISDAEIELSRQFLDGEVDVDTVMSQLAEMFRGALPRYSSPGGVIVDIQPR